MSSVRTCNRVKFQIDIWLLKAWNLITSSIVTSFMRTDISQMTDSLQGGVVSEPKYVTYPSFSRSKSNNVKGKGSISVLWLGFIIFEKSPLILSIPMFAFLSSWKKFCLTLRVSTLRTKYIQRDIQLPTKGSPEQLFHRRALWLRIYFDKPSSSAPYAFPVENCNKPLYSLMTWRISSQSRDS